MGWTHDRGLGSLDAILGLHIRLAHGAVHRHFTESFADLDLTQKQVSVLWLVADRPGIAQIELAATLQIDRATMMAIVHGLERRALIERRPVARDARRRELHLTPAGETALAQARVAIDAHEQWLTARFSDREVAVLRALLRRIGLPEADGQE